MIQVRVFNFSHAVSLSLSLWCTNVWRKTFGLFSITFRAHRRTIWNKSLKDGSIVQCKHQFSASIHAPRAFVHGTDWQFDTRHDA